MGKFGNIRMHFGCGCVDTCDTNIITPGECACWRTNDIIDTAIRTESTIQWDDNSGVSGLVTHGYFRSLPANTDGAFIFNGTSLFNSTASKIIMGLFDSEDVLNSNREIKTSIDARHWYTTGNSSITVIENGVQKITPVAGAYIGAKDIIIQRISGVIKYYTGTTLRYTSPDINNNEFFAFFIGERNGYKALNVRIELKQIV